MSKAGRGGRFLLASSQRAAVGLIGNVLGFLGGFVLARALGPERYGLLQGYKLVYLLGGLASLGVIRSVRVLVAEHLAQGELRQATRTEATGFWIQLGTHTLAAALLVLAFVGREGSWTATGMVVTGVVLVLSQTITYLDTILVVRRRVSTSNTLTLGRAALTFLIRLTTVPFLGLATFWVADLATVVTLPRSLRELRTSRYCRWSGAAARSLLAIGLPLYISSQVGTLFRMADRGIIAAVLGPEALGMYGIASTLITLGTSLIIGVNSVWFPRCIGGLTRGEDATARELDTLGAGLPWLIGTAAILIGVFAGVTIPWLLPRFGPSLEIYALLAPQLVMVASTAPMSPVYLVHRHQRWLALTSVLLLVLGISADALALQWGFGAEGVAAATVLVNYFGVFPSLYLGLRLLGRDILPALGEALRLSLPGGLFALVTWSMRVATGQVLEGATRELVSGAGALVLLSPALWGAARDMQLAPRLRDAWQGLRSGRR